MDKIVLDRILKAVKSVKKKGPYIRVIEYPAFYIVSTDVSLDPMVFTKDGVITPVNFVEIKKEQLKNPKLVYKE